MKKITFTMVALLSTIVSFAQITLSNNTDDNVTASNSVGCPNNNDNNWARLFDMADFAVPNGYGLISGEIGIQSLTTDVTVSVNVYSATVPFDEFSLELLGTQDVTITAATGAPGIFEFTFEEAVMLPDDVPAIFVEVSLAGGSGSGYFIGGTPSSLPGKESYLKSLGCDVPEYITASSINFPDAHFYITVTADESLSTVGNLQSQISIYPTPAIDVINIKTPASMEINEVVLYDLQGRNTGAVFTNGTVNVSGLSRGVYMLTVNTSEGTLTQKVVKK
jgi:hypothetical protein